MKTLSLILTTIAFTFSLNAQTIKIAAAADLKFAMPELVALYQKKHQGIRVDVSYGSSGMFYQQIANGAMFDLFFSADILYPQKLREQGMVNGAVHTYAFGALVLFATNGDITKGMALLTDKSTKRIAIANPAHAPYGKRAEECLQFYKIYGDVKDKLVFGENISQTAQFAFSGNADVAIIALSIALSPEMLRKGKYFTIDATSYGKLEQGCVQLKNTKANPNATQFMQFVLSAECKPIFEKYGFIVP